jgi:transcriptional regulator with XRE-family HTH domain
MKTKTEPANEVYRARLRQWRGSRTQREAAALLGMSVWTYRNYEQGQRRVARDLILRLENDYGQIEKDSLRDDWSQ